MAERIFNPRKWDDVLIDTALPPVAVTMADAAEATLASVGVRLRKGSESRAKGFDGPHGAFSGREKATTASEWLESQGIDDPIMFLDQIGIATEFPQWLKQKIIAEVVETFDQDYWKGMNDTTLDTLESKLAIGLSEGLSVPKMAANIAAAASEISKKRATLIARTEMTHALNAGRDASIQGLKEELGEAGKFVSKSWLSVLGNTTRDTHAGLDGKLADENGEWLLRGVRVPWPGHIALPVGERANCQCTILTEVGVGAPEGEVQELIAEREEVLAGREEFPQANPDGKSTIEQFKNADGTWTKERQALHDRIIDEHFEGKSAVKNPNSYMLGGGPASRKSTVLDAGLVDTPENTVKVDSDGIKGSLPEYTAMLEAKDKGAASFVHEESSHISKRIMARAIEEKHNVLLDGTGDSSLDGLRKKTKKLRAGGREVNADYMTIDTDLSVKIADARGKKTGRFVPESVVRGIHSSVSRVVPQAIEEGLYDNLNVWDNNKQGEPVLIATAKGKKLVVHDKEKWEKFLAKGKEGLDTADGKTLRDAVVRVGVEEKRRKKEETKQRKELTQKYNKLKEDVDKLPKVGTPEEIEAARRSWIALPGAGPEQSKRLAELRRLRKLKRSPEVEQAIKDKKNAADAVVKFNEDAQQKGKETKEALAKMMQVPEKDRINMEPVFDPDLKGKTTVKKGIQEFSSLVREDAVSSDKSRKVGFQATNESRASYSERGTAVRVPRKSRTEKATISHELGHWLEDVSPEAKKAVRKLRAERTKDSKLTQLGKGYEADEKYRPRTDGGKWIDNYMGKVYSDGSTEMLSMGVELYASDPLLLAEKDPELFELIADIARGNL
jgi:predicted ABC-type ATPase